MSDQNVGDCFICRKHRGDIAVPGGAVYEDDLVYAGHAALPEGEPTAYLGFLLVEPKRHVAGLPGLTGLGVAVAIAINLCGGGALLVWLVAGDLGVPMRGRVILWAVAVAILALGVVEAASGSWREGGDGV
jgi:hypothetical protein